jgi:hypothetical protein
MSKRISYLDEETLNSTENDILFEHNFFSRLAGSEEYEVIPVGYNQGVAISDEEKVFIALQAKATGKKLLFRVTMGNIAITFGEDSDVIGISPEFNIHGFPC